MLHEKGFMRLDSPMFINILVQMRKIVEVMFLTRAHCIAIQGCNENKASNKLMKMRNFTLYSIFLVKESYLHIIIFKCTFVWRKCLCNIFFYTNLLIFKFFGEGIISTYNYL
jgi:hypothetical protein